MLMIEKIFQRIETLFAYSISIGVNESNESILNVKVKRKKYMVVNKVTLTNLLSDFSRSPWVTFICSLNFPRSLIFTAVPIERQNIPIIGIMLLKIQTDISINNSFPCFSCCSIVEKKVAWRHTVIISPLGLSLIYTFSKSFFSKFWC